MSKQQKKILITLGFLLLLPYSELASTVVNLKRTGCMGACPVYQLTIYGDGTVIYDGYAYVEVTGMQITYIPRSKVNELIQRINKANFFALEHRYASAVTDLPTITILVRLGLRTKTVVRYGNGPAALICLESKIDEVANVDQWIGVFSVNQHKLKCNS